MLDLSQQSDEALVQLSRDGLEEALEILLDRYKPLAKSLASRFFIQGADRDDAVQEAMIGLFKAVRTFDPTRQIPFAALAKVSCERTLIDAVRKADTGRNRLLNESVPLESDVPESVPDENAVSSSVTARDLLDELAGNLSEREHEVLRYRLQNKSYREIAELCKISPKSVDNALQRIRLKLR